MAKQEFHDYRAWLDEVRKRKLEVFSGFADAEYGPHPDDLEEPIYAVDRIPRSSRDENYKTLGQFQPESGNMNFSDLHDDGVKSDHEEDKPVPGVLFDNEDEYIRWTHVGDDHDMYESLSLIKELLRG